MEDKFIQRLRQELDNQGMLDVLRHGIVDYGVRFKLAYFKPETLALYNQNILTVTRQVYYSLKNKNSIDLLLSLNGLPVATVELKNQFTRQQVGHAKRQHATWAPTKKTSSFENCSSLTSPVSSPSTPEPFHLYSMRQAIEEGFILDVRQNYTTYKTYFRLSKAIEDDPKLNKKKAARAIARFVSLHPHDLAQKTEVMIEHFRQCVMHKIGGKAKAMVVTASRPHVVRYKQEFDAYLKAKGYSDIRALVAFTAFTDKKTGVAYTEAEMNGFGEKELPEKFAGDEYNLLLAAEKYQTGFDQPLLHTMYIVKKLSGVRAVQTLSRLNRTAPGKEDTFMLDFANSEEEILAAFQPFYEKTTLTATTDPNRLYDLKSQLEEYQIIWPNEVDSFARIFFKAQASHTKRYI